MSGYFIILTKGEVDLNTNNTIIANVCNKFDTPLTAEESPDVPAKDVKVSLIIGTYRFSSFLYESISTNGYITGWKEKITPLNYNTCSQAIFDLPANLKSQEYYITIQVDPDNNIEERNEKNNIFNQKFNLNTTNLNTTIFEDTNLRAIPPAGFEDEIITNSEIYNNPFPDTNLNNVEGKAAAELYRRAVIGGYSDGEFKGYRDVNRAEAAKILLLARYGTINDITNNGKFPDVKEGEWYVKYVVTATIKGIINGYQNGFFRSQNSVNTAEFLKMLTLTFGLDENLSYSYNDVKNIDWFAKYAGTATRYELFPERIISLNPEKNLTRKEVAIAIYQYFANR